MLPEASSQDTGVDCCYSSACLLLRSRRRRIPVAVSASNRKKKFWCRSDIPWICYYEVIQESAYNRKVERSAGNRVLIHYVLRVLLDRGVLVGHGLLGKIYLIPCGHVHLGVILLHRDHCRDRPCSSCCHRFAEDSVSFLRHPPWGFPRLETILLQIGRAHV